MKNAINVNGFSFAYEIYEGLVGQNTLLIHGNLASNVWWQPLVEALRQQTPQSSNTSKTGKLICAEWRGCGQNRDGLNDTNVALSLEILANDFNKLLSQLHLQDVCVVAHSTGGPIALQAIHQHPDLYSSLVLLDSVSAKGVQFGPDMHAAFSQMSKDRAFCEMIIMSTIYQTEVSRELKEHIVDSAFNVHPRVWHGIPELLHTLDISELCKSIMQPVLVLHGEHDLLLPRTGSEELASLLPNAQFELIAGHGHCCNVEEPRLLIHLIQQFQRSHGRVVTESFVDLAML